MGSSEKNISQPWAGIGAIVLFFFYPFPFIFGLTLPLLLTPVWVYFLDKWKMLKKEYFVAGSIFFLFYAVVHVLHGVVWSYYLVSTCILIALLFFTAFIFQVFRNAFLDLDRVFRLIIMLNFVFALACLVALLLPILKPLVWYTISISANIEPIPRLKLFTPEASHYSYILSPLFIYCCARFLFFEVKRPWLTVAMVTLPMLLSFSLGVMGSLAISGCVILLLFYRKIFRREEVRKRLLLVFSSLFIIGLLLAIVYPDNPLYHRITNIWVGTDTSARGRTYESFILAHKVIAQKSFLFGIGPGQLKVFGRDIIIQYYHYSKIPEVVRIPNACAETIVCFGYVGLALRLALQLLLLYRTKLYCHPFRLWLFLFLFIYQFTGSYITNAIEYMLWALAFAPVFPDFLTSINTKKRRS